ncbi:MAG: [protein-PII] uridylyltransferase, partial [Micavibrio aeruginosavorus]
PRLFADGEKRAFMKNKLAERDERHNRYGNTRYVLEPNIKEGKGGLRDYQTLLWITNVLYGVKRIDELVGRGIITEREAYKFQKSHDFLLTVRCHLHEIAGRAEERIHFDIQPDLADRLGYKSRHTGRAVERFMKHYFLVTRDIGDLTRILCAAIEHDDALQPEKQGTSFLGFQLTDGRLSFDKGRNLRSNPVDMLRLFHVFQQDGHDIHPAALKDISRNLRYINDTVRENEQANDIFIDILTAEKNTALTLRRMNEAGLLGRFIPDFGRIIALTQFDRYHYFTVDEHIINCIDIMDDLRAGKLGDDAPIASGVAKTITQKRALYVALFLHDICKGRGGRHAELGAELAYTLCPRFGLSGEETDLVSWLIHEHLLMSDTAFRRNLNDPKTIADFSARIRTSERLDMLFALTTVDIMGVGPGRWTAWKARLLEELYAKTRALMDGEEPGIVENIHVPDDLAEGETRVDITTDESQSASVVIVYTPDRRGLFATLSGALSAEGANIMRAHINTLNGRLAVDRFVIQNASGLPFRQERRQEDLRQTILAALDGTLDIEARIAAYHKPMTRQDAVFNIPPRINLNNEASGTDTVVEIETRDRHGLLHDIACAMREEGLDIRAAKINTQGLRAIDSFYVQTAKRKKLTDAKAQERLVMRLFETLAKP